MSRKNSARAERGATVNAGFVSETQRQTCVLPVNDAARTVPVDKPLEARARVVARWLERRGFEIALHLHGSEAAAALALLSHSGLRPASSLASLYGAPARGGEWREVNGENLALQGTPHHPLV